MYPVNFKLFITLIFLFSLFSVNGQIVTDRPDQTESSSTVGQGNLQLESGVHLSFEGEHFLRNQQILAPSTLIRYGIFKGVELRMRSQFESNEKYGTKYHGISDLELGAKIQLYQKEGSSFEVAFLSHLLLPSGSAEVTGNVYGSINKLALAHDINDHVGIGYNLGYNYFGAGSGDLTYSLALGIGINEKVGIYFEPYGDVIDFAENMLNFDSGVTYLIHKNLQLDFSFGTGVNHRMNHISIGCSWKAIK